MAQSGSFNLPVSARQAMWPTGRLPRFRRVAADCGSGVSSGFRLVGNL